VSTSADGPRRLDQDLAKAATRILRREGSGELRTISPDLRTRYRQLPTMVRLSGLAATVAYLVSKSGKTGSSKSDLEQAYTAVVDGIRARLQEQGYHLGAAPLNSNDALVLRLADLPPGEYARASAEIEALAIWLSRLAEARFKAQSGTPETP